jgi:hypothetical protein
VGNGNIDVGKATPARKPGQPLAERLLRSDGLPELRIDQPVTERAAHPGISGAMAQQSDQSGYGNQSAPQGLLHLVGCREKARPDRPKVPSRAPTKR